MKKLDVIYGKQNSFYGKAEYSVITGPICIAELRSYGTTVFKLERYGTNPARITIDGQGRYSKTTDRHIKEFKTQLDHGNFGTYFELMYKEAKEAMENK